jgi:hypothetical protein
MNQNFDKINSLNKLNKLNIEKIKMYENAFNIILQSGEESKNLYEILLKTILSPEHNMVNYFNKFLNNNNNTSNFFEGPSLLNYISEKYKYKLDNTKTIKKILQIIQTVYDDFSKEIGKINNGPNQKINKEKLFKILHLCTFKTPILEEKKICKNVKSIVGISPTMV